MTDFWIENVWDTQVYLMNCCSVIDEIQQVIQQTWPYSCLFLPSDANQRRISWNTAPVSAGVLHCNGYNDKPLACIDSSILDICHHGYSSVHTQVEFHNISFG